VAAAQQSEQRVYTVENVQRKIPPSFSRGLRVWGGRQHDHQKLAQNILLPGVGMPPNLPPGILQISRVGSQPNCFHSKFSRFSRKFQHQLFVPK
jgi:hypothetical protein